MVTITSVSPGSIAEELELRSGDILLAINGEEVHDLVDYIVLTRDAEELVLEVRRSEGEVWELELEKDADEGLGIEVEHPEPSQCGNQCLFCFVHQLPRGMRPTLYVKDEDYRFSFLYGAYVTLTNLGEGEIERILRQKLSPLYVSVHATDEVLRAKLLGRRSPPPILPLMQRLVAGGIELHTQIVVCPGLNDGDALERTVADLGVLSAGIRSLALVPVGLTGHRERLPELRSHTQGEACQIVAAVARWQEYFLSAIGRRFIFAADEFYLQADQNFPERETYEDFPQYENGVGMIPLFRSEAEEVLSAAGPLVLSAPVDCLTGVAFWPELDAFCRELGAKTGVKIKTHRIVNSYFGGVVSVAGLLTGKDIIAELRGKLSGSVLLLPDVVFRDGEDVFLDNLSPDELGESLGVEVFPVSSSPWGIWHALEALAADEADV